MKTFSIIVAFAKNNAIGKNNKIPWHISEDFKYFKRITLGHDVIMGKNTWLSLPIKPLPGRKNIVVSHSIKIDNQNVEVVPSIERAMEICSDGETFIIGGRKMYEQFMPIASKIYLTKVYKAFDAEVFFPEIDKNEFKLVSCSEKFTDDKSGLQYAFLIYERF